MAAKIKLNLKGLEEVAKRAETRREVEAMAERVAATSARKVSAWATRTAARVRTTCPSRC